MPTFKDIIGQVHIKRHMQRAVAENRVSHAWLLAGEAQMGKELLARTFTQALLCENLREKRKRGELQNPLAAEPCCACASCRKVMSDAHPDVRVVTHEKPTSVRVEEIEDQLVDDAYLTAYASDRKIYIVPDAQMMTAEAQNKLLKTLEEPPSYVTILLLSTGLQALLPTIRSRCLPFTLRPVEHDTLVRFLREKAGASEYRANLAAGFARGNPGLALSLARDARFETRTRGAIQLMEHLQDTGLHEIEERIEDILSEAEEEQIAREELFDIVRDLIRDILVYKATERKEHLILRDRWEYIRDVAAHTAYDKLIETDRALNRARSRIRANVNAQLSTDLFLLSARENLSRSSYAANLTKGF